MKLDVDENILKAIRESVTQGVNNGMQIIMDRINQQEQIKDRIKRDRRLRNTTLLLRNYNNFKEHIEKSVFSTKQLKSEKIEEELDIDVNIDETYIQAIMKSKERTRLLLKQIDSFLKYYEFRCLSSKKEDVQRRIQIIKMLYTNEETLTQEEVAEELGINERTVRNTKDIAIKELSTLFFGIDGLKLK